MKQVFVLFILMLAAMLPAQERMNKELSINEAIQTGLKNNPEIKSAYEQINQAKGKFWSGISLPMPEISLSYEYTPVNSSLSSYGERTYEVSQSLEFPSNYFLRGSRLNKEEETAFHNLKQTEITVTAQIKTAYYNVIAKEELLKSAEENLKIAQDFSKKAEIRYNAGEGTNLERLTGKVQFTEAKNNTEIVRNSLKTASAELNYALGYGVESDEEFDLTDSLIFNQQDIPSFDELYDIALSANQQLKISELNVNTTSINKSLAWSSLLPGLNISYFRQSLGGDNNSYYGASFGMSVPLWFLFQNRGEIQEASANLSVAEFELQKMQNEIYLNLRTAYNNYENDLKQVQLYFNDILPQAEEIFHSASASYDAGEITYLEYLQARQTKISASGNYINLLLNYNLSKFKLEETIGRSLTDGENK